MKALPKMIQEAQSDALRAALSEHLEVYQDPGRAD
jgi:ferritin-like metal-binding protein YciE